MTGEGNRDKGDLKQRLSAEQFHVTQEGGTERPFMGEHYANKAPGEYLCVVCGSLTASNAAQFLHAVVRGI